MYWHQGCVNTATVSIQREGAKVRIHIYGGANTYLKNNSSNSIFLYWPHCEYRPRMHSHDNLVPQGFFPACIDFVPGGIYWKFEWRIGWWISIAIASDFRVDGARSPEILQKQGALGSGIAARNRTSLATFHRTLKNRNAALLSLFSEIAAMSVEES